jgi:hypothetical protein
MPRFYFHLTSKDSRIPDERGKELNTLNDAYVYARNLIDKILFHVGYDDAGAWKVIISNDSYEAQMIVPFPMSYSHCPWRAVPAAQVLEAKQAFTNRPKCTTGRKIYAGFDIHACSVRWRIALCLSLASGSAAEGNRPDSPWARRACRTVRPCRRGVVSRWLRSLCQRPSRTRPHGKNADRIRFVRRAQRMDKMRRRPLATQPPDCKRASLCRSCSWATRSVPS